MRIFCVANVICLPIIHWTSGFREQAFVILIQFSINTLYLPWACNASIDVLRRRRSLKVQAEFYTSRALKIAGFQILLLVAAVGQGVDGRETYPRIYATFVFSASLSFAWSYLVSVFDVAAVSSREAAKLRLSCLQATALALIGSFVLAGLGGYVLAGQKEPPKKTTFITGFTMMATGLLALFPVGRLVWIARYHHGSDDSPAARVKPIDGLGSLDVIGA